MQFVFIHPDKGRVFLGCAEFYILKINLMKFHSGSALSTSRKPQKNQICPGSFRRVSFRPVKFRPVLFCPVSFCPVTGWIYVAKPAKNT